MTRLGVKLFKFKTYHKIKHNLGPSKMNKLPSVLRKEIWEYVHGGHEFWKTRFNAVISELDVQHAFWVSCQIDHFDHVKLIKQTVLSPISKKELMRAGLRWMKEKPKQYKQALRFALARDRENPLFKWADFVFNNQVYDCFRDVDEKGQDVYKPKFHPPSMERFSWAPLIPSYFRSSQNTAMTARPIKRKAEIPMTQLDISSFMVKK
jgi:hypothetical protein